MNWRITQLTIGLVALAAAYFFYVETTHDDTTTEEPESEVITTTPTVSGGMVVIDWHGQELQQVPQSLFEQVDTEVLDLSNNELSGALPAEVHRLTKLRRLDLSNNNFTGLPAELGQLSQLEYLNISGNPITGLPYELGNLKNLKELNLRATNYSTHDLEIITQSLPAGVIIYK
ncbi:MAG: leucine-rich repeat domain-containing protein [Candidatus Nomurabacteria bacterium]|nr:MAG: leucine-rich repeat domain-containing protein [Candidatus Nomurabacteria bacterium]